MSEEIKQKDWTKNEKTHFKLSYIYRNNFREVDATMSEAQEVLNEFLSQALQKQREEIIKLIKTPMSTEFEDPEEESADYSIEDFRARLLSTLTTK